jgi:hypothetical protein
MSPTAGGGGTGDVWRDPKGADDGTRCRGKRGGGDRVLSRALTGEDERAKKKGGTVATERPL